jgi:hypothetical protein
MRTTETATRAGRIAPREDGKGLALYWWELEYHIPPHWDDEKAVEQVTLFCEAVLASCRQMHTREGQRRAGIVQNFIQNIPVHLPQVMAQWRRGNY